MQYSHYKDADAYPKKKVSIQQAINILKRNGIQTTNEQAAVILDFLYILAKASNAQKHADE
jgi:hypothetical protein